MEINVSENERVHLLTRTFKKEPLGSAESQLNMAEVMGSTVCGQVTMSVRQ